MDSQISILQSVKDWIEATSQLLSTQSSLEQLSASDVDTIVNQLKTLLSTVDSLGAISAACDAVDLLLQVNGDMVDNRDEVLEILQMMLNEFVEQPANEDEDYAKEEVGERLSQVIEQAGQGVFASEVLDGVAGHLLELVGKEETATNVRNSFLRALLFLASSTEIEDRERLGEEYVADLDKLVDWLFSCGDYTTQTALVELLRRMTPSSLLGDLVDNWFPGNATVQSLFLSSDARAFLNTFNQSLPAVHMRVLSVEINSAQVGSQVLVKQTSRSSWTDFNLGSATISINCDEFQIVIPADTVKGAAISSINGLLTLRLELATPLNVEGEDASLMQLEFPLTYAAAVPTFLHQLLGQRLQMDQRLRSSRSNSIRLPGGAAAHPVASVFDQPHQELTGEARVTARRKSSSSGVLMCRKATLLESPSVNLSGVDARESRDTAIQERVDTPPIREASARAARAKVMEERRRELEQSISQAETKSRQGSAGVERQKKDPTSGSGQDTVQKRKRRKSSRSIGEVRCRKEPESPISQVNSGNEIVSSKAGGLVASRDALLTEQEKAEDVSQEHECPKVDSKEADVGESNGAGGSLQLEPTEVEIAEEFLEEAVNEVAGTDVVEMEERTALDLATSRKGISGKEESSNQTEANREQVVEEIIERGEQLQQPGEDLEQQPSDEAAAEDEAAAVMQEEVKLGNSRGLVVNNKSNSGDEASTSTSRSRKGKAGLKKMLGKVPRAPGFGKHTSRRVSVSPTLGDISEVSASGFQKRKASSALVAGGEKRRKLGLNSDKAENQRGDPGENNNSLRISRTVSCGSEGPGDVEEEGELQAGGDDVNSGEEEEVRVGDVCRELESNICPTDTLEKLPGIEKENNVCPTETPERFPDLIIGPNVVQLTDCGDKIVDEVFDQNIVVAEADNEVNAGSEYKKSFENRNSSSNYSGGVDSSRRDTSKVAQLAQDWSDEELENSGNEQLGGMGDIVKRGVEMGEVGRGRKGEAGGSDKRKCGNGEVGENVSFKKKGAEKEKKKKVSSWRRKPEATEQLNKSSEADGSRKAGSGVGSKKKRLLGSKSVMLQDSPVMLDAPTFDTTLPAFEEAHNTSKHQNSFQEAPQGVTSSIQDKLLGERRDISHENGRSSAIKITEPSIRSDRKAVDAKAKNPKHGQSRRKVNAGNRIKANVGNKRKAEMKNAGGKQRKAPRRTVSHFTFTNYDHLKIIPHNLEDVNRSFHDVSSLSAVSKPRQFFKRGSPIPETNKKNKTSRLNLTASFMRRSGVVSKRRSKVDASAIASIILPHETRTQTNNWDYGDEEMEGRASRVRRLASARKSSRPTMVDVSSSTDQGVTMTVEEFNQVLHLVASGIQLASDTEGADVLEQKTKLLRELKQQIKSV